MEVNDILPHGHSFIVKEEGSERDIIMEMPGFTTVQKVQRIDVYEPGRMPLPSPPPEGRLGSSR